MRLVFFSIAQIELPVKSKFKLEVKKIGQELQNEVLFISVPQLLLEIQQNS